MKRIEVDKRERPVHAVGHFQSSDDRSDLLPNLAKGAGFELRTVEFCLDPFVLYDKRGLILYEWECGYEPHWTEVYKVCARFLWSKYSTRNA